MNRSPELFAAFRREIAEAPLSDLPSLVGLLSTLHAEAWSRMVSPTMASPRDNQSEDGLLTIGEVAERLHVSQRFVRNHAEEIGRVQLGRAVRFSQQRLDAYIQRKRRAS